MRIFFTKCHEFLKGSRGIKIPGYLINDIFCDLREISLFSGLACSCRYASNLTVGSGRVNVIYFFLWFQTASSPSSRS
jgi:hypothetical protein